MENIQLKSRCTQGSPLIFRWFGDPASLVGLDLETLLFKFEAIARARGDQIHEHSLIIAKAEIRNRIERACRGRLRSTHHIKWVDRNNLPPIFEMRWQGNTLSSPVEQGKQRFRTLLIRMYYSEPGSNPKYFIGHHIHEKNISDPERTKLLQNKEIRIAREFCKVGQASNWGIPLDHPH
jgi:hypothetical protein